MRRAALLLIVGGLVALGGHALWRAAIGGATYSWRQRLTVEVETPSGEASGAAVTSVRKTDTSGPFVPVEARGVHTEVSGEAVAVEVAPGRWLFALLKGPGGDFSDAGHWFYAAYGLDKAPSFEASMAQLRAEPRDQPRPLPPEAWPLMVTFDDINDPKSVRRVDPDDLDAAFGCDRPVDPALMPWRAEGRTYRNWAVERAYRLAGAQAAKDAGITGPAAEALVEYSWINGRNYRWQPGDDEKNAQLKTQFTSDQRDRWEKTIRAIDWGRNLTLPTPADIAAPTGGPCYRLRGLTLAVTREPVTEGKVEGVLGWLVSANYIVPPDPTDLYGDRLTFGQKIMPSDFMDWQTLMKKNEENK